MAAKRTRGRGLAGQMLLFALGVVFVAVLAIGAISLRGVYSLVLTEDAARLGSYRQLLVDDISGRLSLVSRLVDPLGRAGAIAQGSREALPKALQSAVLEDAEYLDALAVTDASGTVLAESVSGVFPRAIAVPSLVGTGTSPYRVGFSWRRGAGASTPFELWASRRIEGGASETRLVVARVRTGFVHRLLDEIASGTLQGSVLLVSSDGRLVDAGAGGVAVPTSMLRFTPDAAVRTAGVASAKAVEGGGMRGLYAEVRTAPELRWRVVVLESELETMARVREALLPAGLATVLVLALVGLAAFMFARRLAAPLSEFERRARDIAAGGYVRQMVVERSDELGRLAEAFNQIGVRVNSLQDIAQLLAGASEPEEVYDAVLSAIAHLLGTSDAAILLADGRTESLVLVRGRGLREPDLRFSVAFSETSPVTAALRERTEIPFEGKATRWASPIFHLFDAAEDRSGVAVPLVVGTEVLGVVVALSSGRHPLTKPQIETVRAFCSQAAVAVRTSRLFEHEHTSRRESEALREAAELIVGTRELGFALERVALVAGRLLGMNAGPVAIVDRDEFGLAPAHDPEAECAAIELWRSRTDEHITEPIEPLVLESEGGTGTTLLVPLVREGEVKGVFVLTSGPSVPGPGAREIALAGTLGKEVSLALENAALLQEARTRAANLDTVFRISQAVSSSLKIRVVLNRVLDVVQKIFSADAVSLMRYDEEKKTIETSMARGVANREMLYLRVAPGEDIPGAVFESRAPRMCGDLSVVESPLARLATAQGLRSLLAVPLLARGRSTGVLTVYDRRDSAFGGEDMELLLTFASQAALAIDTASVYEREHHLASVLQSSILPERLPEVAGLDTGIFYLAAGGEADIGGDYYDLFELRDGTVVIAIADVCGKGVRAATKTSMIKHSLRGLVAAGAGPGSVLEELNRLVAVSGDPSDIVTAWVGFLDPGRHVLRYANGGHPPALLRRAASGRFARFAPTGPLLGAIESAGFDERTAAIEQGDLLVLYTDGVTEARCGTRFFGEGRIRRVMRRPGSAQAVADNLSADVGTFSGGIMRDDAAVLVVKVMGDRPPADSGGG